MNLTVILCICLFFAGYEPFYLNYLVVQTTAYFSGKKKKSHCVSLVGEWEWVSGLNERVSMAGLVFGASWALAPVGHSPCWTFLPLPRIQMLVGSGVRNWPIKAGGGGFSAGGCVVLGHLGPLNRTRVPVASGSLGLSPFGLGLPIWGLPPSLAWMNARMCGLRSLVLLGAVVGVVVLFPSLSASGLGFGGRLPPLSSTFVTKTYIDSHSLSLSLTFTLTL